MGQRQSGVIGVLLFAIGLISTHVAGADKRLARDHYKRGMAHFVMERWDEAITEFDAGFTEEPLPEFLYNIAQAHRKAGRAARAIAFYKKYLSLMPDNAPDRRQVELEMEAAREELPPPPPSAPVAAPVPAPAPVPEPARPNPSPPSVSPPSPRITIERVPAPSPVAPVSPSPVVSTPAPVVRAAAPPAPVTAPAPAPVTPSPLVASIENPPPRTAPVEESPFVETHTVPVETPIAPPSRSHAGGRIQAAGAVLLVVGAGIAVGGGLGFHYASQSAADQIIGEQNDPNLRYDPALYDAMTSDQTLSIAAYASGGALAALGAILVIEGALVKSRESRTPSVSLVPALTPRAAGFALSGSF